MPLYFITLQYKGAADFESGIEADSREDAIKRCREWAAKNGWPNRERVAHVAANDLTDLDAGGAA